CESNVGGAGYGPAGEEFGIVPVDAAIDESGSHHPAQGRDSGQHHLIARGEIAFKDLALDLKPDKKEEDRHQSVIDPQEQRLGEDMVSDADGDGGGKEIVIDGSQAADVDGDESSRRGERQDQSGRRLMIDEGDEALSG